MYELNLMGLDRQKDSYRKRAGKVLSEDYARTAADFGRMYSKGREILDSAKSSLRELYRNGAEKIQAYANGPAYDSFCSSLSKLLDGKETEAMKNYIAAQQLINAGSTYK